MIENIIIKKITKYEDNRGYLSELFRKDDLNGYLPEMAYLSYTEPNIIRGPHEHKFQSDLFIFLGPGNFRLYLWDRRENSQTKGESLEIEVGELNPVSVLVPPGVVHGYKCISEVSALSLNFPDKLYRGEAKREEIDEIRWEEDENSPYQIN
ncbi:dTDP-4-dehydrorhamnose 3,5-epimerase [Candidatus Falkowbacteria bacterium]|nr:dTDP-4-dehydrorhamnose 3,5-epimerase [Candidatus Falkowbacteria bacterium]